MYPLSRQCKVTPIAPPTGCSIRPVPNRNLYTSSRLRTCVMQSRDCAHVLRNPKIACAISEFRECAMQSRDCAEHIFEYMPLSPYVHLASTHVMNAPRLSPFFVYYCEHKRKVKTGEAWEQGYDTPWKCSQAEDASQLIIFTN